MKRLPALAALSLAFAAALALACRTTPRPAPASPAPATEPAAAPSGVEAATLRHCCEQCAGASGRDPAGMDISTKQCTSYPEEFNGGPGVDAECAAFFAPRGTRVGECWKLGEQQP